VSASKYRLKSPLPVRYRNQSVARTGWASVVRFNADVIVEGNTQLLLATEVLLCCLHAYVSKKKLDLPQFAAREVAETSTRPPQIVRARREIPMPPVIGQRSKSSY
jgi:hypothetical protein